MTRVDDLASCVPFEVLQFGFAPEDVTDFPVGRGQNEQSGSDFPVRGPPLGPGRLVGKAAAQPETCATLQHDQHMFLLKSF